MAKEIETAASTAQQPSAKQCIFFPVKEEERELLLTPSERVESKYIHMIFKCLNTTSDYSTGINICSVYQFSFCLPYAC